MYKNAHNLLISWYEQNGRHDLPWRTTDDPYAIWVSEIMLQQTQVKTVLERFYFPFLKRFPTLQALADADLDDVLKQWEGLGYYTRARNLHKAAQLAAPELPQTVTQLHALPGIGQSTAHAIAAFAHGTPVPILDANVKRILYRVFAKKEAKEKALWELAYRLFDPKHPFAYNQAMMDLGSTVCTQRQPLCDACPFHTICEGKDRPLSYPQKKAKKTTPVRRKTIVIHTMDGKLALKQRQSRFLHGLWGFSEYEYHEQPDTDKKLGELIHVYSHFRLEAEVWLCEAPVEEHEWFTPEEIAALALSGADHKALKLFRDSHGIS